jgi:hypothetical protein
VKCRVSLQKLETLLLHLTMFLGCFDLKINLLSMHRLRVGHDEGDSFKSAGARESLALFRFKVEPLSFALSDGLLRRQLFKALILVNHFRFTTCGWATFE